MTNRIVQNFRLIPFAFDLLVEISKQTGETKTQVIERALIELLRQHPEYWPKKAE